MQKESYQIKDASEIAAKYRRGVAYEKKIQCSDPKQGIESDAQGEEKA